MSALEELTNTLEQDPEFVQVMEEAKLHFEFGNTILRARIRKGWSQIELARQSGVSVTRISEYEFGLGNPTLSTIRKLAQALGLNFHLEEV